MRIIILGTAYPYRGGLAAFNERLAREYQQHGHEVTIYTFRVQYPNFLFPGKSQYSEEEAPKGLKIERKVNSCNPLNWIKVGREVRKMQPDLLITKYWLPFMAPCLGTIARMAGKKVRKVSVLDNVIPHEHRIGDKLFSRYFISGEDGFVAMSQSVLDDLGLFDQKKKRLLCPHPLYDHYGEQEEKAVARQTIGVEEEGRYVLFFGFIRAYKGLDLLLEAMADKRLEEMGVKLIVAGEFYGDPKPYLEQIERLGLKERVVMRTDFIPDSQVNHYFCASDIVAQPYKSATQSGVTQIAFHFDKPMLVTRVGGLPEIVPDGKIGYVVEPQAEAIAKALVRYYKEEKETDFVEGVREEKKKYAWEKLTQAIEEVGQV